MIDAETVWSEGEIRDALVAVTLLRAAGQLPMHPVANQRSLLVSQVADRLTHEEEVLTPTPTWRNAYRQVKKAWGWEKEE